jgi:hypothetical protein
MHFSPVDSLAVIAGAFILVALSLFTVAKQLHRRWRARVPRLRVLAGSLPQRTALRLALAPVVREFLPLLERAGQEVQGIVVVPTLTGAAGEPVVAAVEQVAGAATYVVRLAQRVDATIRQPEEIAGTLAEDLLFLYRSAATVTVIRQTPPAVVVGVEPAPRPTPPAVPRPALTTLPLHAVRTDAEGTVVAFRPSPSGVPGQATKA